MTDRNPTPIDMTPSQMKASSRPLTLVGPSGGTSAITGAIERSSILPGLWAVETEHGTLYLDGDLTTPVAYGD